MESKQEKEKLEPEDAKFIYGEKGKFQVIEIVDNKFASNLASPFINRLKSWENEDDFSIPNDIIENIEYEL